MGITEILTIIFVVCKVGEVGEFATWSWGRCLLPELIALIPYAMLFIRYIKTFTDDWSD